ncbi:aminopeptidase [Ramlibacter rhizophilus]|uniref:Aminopeptidase n=1 Tax=Ramlibacter rhizophilus TaxID=1781167 RepID=A0A4Z0BK28_9BURK|nr:aminopeptidase [Ramlibacter rhizophilus]TFY99656.1 aminopeptidase [Ramlibacter rhizophilus]
MNFNGRLVALSLAAALGLGACASGTDLGYVWQSASGHLAMLNAARPVPDWVVDGQSPDKLKERLALSQHIRRFASRELKLPDNPSYTRYADLKRPAAIWNVVAAPELSLKLKTWCFPIAGCVGYRGYFDESAAEAQAERLRAQGLEASVYPVPAYSTLGWMNWAGGDPLLNTFINYREAELARLLFHELAHQVLYVKNDTTFNESFATAVERLGVERYLASAAKTQDTSREWLDFLERRRAFRELTRGTRERLSALYDSELPAERQRAEKDEIMRAFRAGYAALRERWGGDPARFRLSDRWVARANNATFGAQAAYDELVPGFEALFELQGRDWERFYAAARQLAERPKDERHRFLKEIAGA